MHRDLKPRNVLVDADGQVKLLDFGIAKLLDDEDAPGEATELTREGGRVLTPQYAAPEQMRGEAVTTATDVYALGVLLYVLLTGQHPRVRCRRQALAGRRGAAAGQPRGDRHRSRRGEGDCMPAAAARGATPRALAAALAGDLDNILAKALRAEPAERYATAAAFADDLRRHLDGQTVSARPDSLGLSREPLRQAAPGGRGAGDAGAGRDRRARPAWPSTSGARPNASATWRPGNARTPRRS